MATFDVDSYFANRVGNSSTGKLDSLAQASQDKVNALTAYRDSKDAAGYTAPEVPNADSWVNKLGLNPDNITGEVVNLAASLGYGATRAAGQLASLPFNASAIMDESNIDDADVAAYTKYKQGIATEEDTKLLSQIKNGELNTFQLMERASNSRKTGMGITDFMDTSKNVHQGKRDRLANELGDNFQGAWDTTKQGASDFMDGNVLSGAADMVSGVVRLGGNAAHALATNKGAVGEYVFENAPQLLIGGVLGKVGQAALAASNVGYGAEYYQKGIKDYQDAGDGSLPSVDQRKDMGLHAALAVGAEQAGDMVQLGAMKLAKKSADEIIRTGFKQSLKNTFTAGGKGFAAEAPVEAFQTYAEGEASLRPASDKDIYTGGVIGGAAGGVLTGGGRVLAEGAKATPEHAQKRAQDQQATVDHQKAMETNDTSAYLDVKNKATYNPTKAVEVLIGNSQREDTTAEAKKENITKANQIVTDLEERAAEMQDHIDSSSPEHVAVHQANIARYKEALANIDPADKAGIAKITKGLEGTEIQLADVLTPKQLKEKEFELRTLERHIEGARQAKLGLNLLVQPKDADIAADIELADTVPDAADTTAVEAHSKAVARVLTLSMASPGSVTADAAKRLADNVGNSLTPAQRDYFRVFSDARIAENQLKDMDKVSQDIFNGSKEKGKTRQLGIADYNLMMGEAIAAGNEKAATRHLAGLTEFARNHQDKAATAQKAADTVKGRQAQIVFNKESKSWEIAAETKSDAWMAANGGFTLSKPADAIARFSTEANALNKSAAALKAAYALKFGKPATVTSTASTVVNSTTTVDSKQSPTVSANQGQLQSNKDSTVDPVVVSTKEVKSTKDVSLTDEGNIPTKEQDAPAATKTAVAVPSKELFVAADNAFDMTSVEVMRAVSKEFAPFKAEKDVLVNQKQSLERDLRIEAINDKYNELMLKYAPIEQLEDVRKEWTEELQDLDDADPEWKQARGAVLESNLAKLDAFAKRIASKATQQTSTAEEDGEPTSVAESVNPADSAGKLVALQNKSPEGTAYTARNLLADFTVQVGQRAGEAAARPLVAVKDFLSKWKSGEISINDFLEDTGEVLSAAQDSAMKMFQTKAALWNRIIQRNTTKKENKDFHFEDLMQFLVQELGDGVTGFEENVKTAISLAAFKAIIDDADASPVAANKQINKMLLRDEDHEVTDAERKQLSRAGVRENIWRNGVGRTAVQALGFKALKDAPLDLMVRLESAFGAHVQKLLMDQEMLVRTPIDGKSMTAMMVDSFTKEATNEEATAGTQFVRLAWERDKSGKDVLPAEIQKIVDSYVGSRDILDKIFSVETTLVPPSLEPIPFTQKTTSGTKEGIPSNIAEAAAEKQKTPLYIREDMNILLDKLSDEAAGEIAGIVALDSKKIHKSKRDGIEAKNRGLERELAHYKLFVSTMLEGPGKDIATIPFYVGEDVWVNQRVGSGTAMFSLQTSKVHRFLAHYERWKTTVDMKEPSSFDHFKQRVAEGMGIKTDKQSKQDTLDNFDALFDPELNESAKGKAAAEARSKAVGVLVATVLREEKMTYDQERALVKGIEVAGEGFHSLDSLMAMAHMRYAQQENLTSFSTTLAGEVDGVANGPILSQILMGAASSVGQMLTKMVRGGFYSEQDEEQQYNLWRGTSGNLDQYETVAQKIVENVRKVIAQDKSKDKVIGSTYDVIEKFTGPLELEGKVQKEGRNVVKTTLTPLMFGSSVETSLGRMADKFIENIYDRIENAANGKDASTAAEIINDINTLFVDTEASLINNKLTMDMLLELEFDKEQVAGIKNSFGKTLGRAVRTTIKENFAEYLIQRDHFNRSAQLSFDLFDSVFQGIREEYVQELIQAEKDKPGTGIAVGRLGNPLHDMTAPQLRVLEKRIEKLKPMMHTSNSKLDGNIKNGVFLGKNTTKTSSKKTYKSVVNFATEFKDKKAKTAYTNSEERSFTSGGVRASSQSVHSLDSGISNDARLGMQAVNVHDAHVVGLQDFLATAEALNQNTWKHLLNFSPMGEAFNALARMVSNLDSFIKEGGLTPGALVNLNNMLEKYALDQKVPVEQVLEHMLTSGKMQAYKADSVKLGFLAQVTAVDQYAAEGGNYKVKPEERAAAQAQLDNLSEVVPAKLLEKAAAITKMILDNKPEGVASTKEDFGTDTELDMKVPAVDLDTLPVVQSRALLAILLKKVDNATFNSKVQQVLTAMNATNTSLAKALSVTLSGDDRKAVREALTKVYNNAPSEYWGVIGKPTTESDPQLVKYFERASDVRVDRVLSMLETRLKERKQTAEVKAQRVLLQELSKHADPKLKVSMVTPATYQAFVIGDKPATPSRGWFTIQPKEDNPAITQEGIYFLSPDFVDSGLTVETLLHEITHSVVAAMVDQKTEAAQPFITDLENLLTKAKEYVATLSEEEQAQFAPAVSSVQEIIAWGMTNQAFQNNILKQVTFQSTTKKLVEGMKGFINAIVGILFNGVGANRKDVANTGLTALITNVSGLFAESKGSKPATSLTQSMASPTASIDAYTTFDLYQALGTNTVDPSFDEHLRGLLAGIVEKLHGPFGSFKDAMQRNQATSALDVWQKAMDTGVAPFASQSRAIGIKMAPQVAFVMEQVEATMLAALNDNENYTSVAYKELDRLYAEVRSKVTAKDFHEGDWATAQPHEQQAANDLYNFVFEMKKVDGNKTDHLARFAALGLTHPRFNNLLEMATKRDTRTLQSMSFNEKLKAIFERVLNWLNGRLTHTTEGQKANEKLTALVEQLVDIESRKKAMLVKRATTKDYTAPLEDGARKLMEVTRNKIAQIAGTDFIKNNSSVFVQAGGAVIKTVMEDRVMQLLDTIADYRNKNWKKNLGFTAGLLNNIRGPVQAFNNLLMGAKEHERERKFIITQISKAVLAGFSQGGKLLNENTKTAISAVLLRTGAHVLLKDFDMAQMAALVNSEPALKAAINKFEDQLNTFGNFKKDFIYQARALAYQKVTGQQKSEYGVLNAGNIARLLGTGNAHKISEQQATQAEPIIDSLVSLYALKYSSHDQKNLIGKLLATENARTEGNGVEFALTIHRELEKQSRERLFEGNEVLMTKGFMPEIYNPHTDIKVANEVDGRNLTSLGYIKGAVVEYDYADPDTDLKHIYVLPDGGMQPYLSGIIAPGSMGAKGSKQHNGNFDVATKQGILNQRMQQQLNATKQAALRLAIDSTTDFDPSKVVPNYMTPVFRADGTAVNWRYMMQESTKDNILDRDNRPEQLLGALAGSIYDKETIGEKNEKAIQALHDEFTSKIATRSDSFVQVGPNAPDPENREIYRLLPEATKESIKKIWGKEGMLVPVELMDITFGYRKLSLSSAFDKVNQNRKNKVNNPSLDEFEGVSRKEHAFIFGVEFALRMYAKVHLKMDDTKADHYAMRGAVVVARAERGWQEAVKMTKDVIVVRTGTVMAANILSNFSLLSLQGVSLPEQIRHHRVGLKGAMAYQDDTEKLYQLNLQLRTGNTNGNGGEIKREIIRLEDALERNPVRKLIEAGMMPTIVEDIAADVDPYSYKTAFARKMEKYTDKLNPVVRDTLKTVVVAQDTNLYKTFSQVTQLSDFVARYTLYQHLTNRKTNPLSHEDAIQQASESFVNYDIPMHRKMQYLDDTGITMFTKYFLGIQRVLLKTTRENPLRVLLALTLNNYFDALPLVTDSSAIAHFGNNPFRTGAFQIFGTGDDLATVKAAMSLIK